MIRPSARPVTIRLPRLASPAAFVPSEYETAPIVTPVFAAAAAAGVKLVTDDAPIAMEF